MSNNRFILIILIVFIASACSTTKNIPEGQYLLDSFKVTHDTKNSTSDLESYVRQQPNSSLPLIGKVRLKIYNMAGTDTSKWINRFIRKIGAPPVLYNNSQTSISLNQLRKGLVNQGYLDATADTVTQKKGKKISVTYNLKGGTPYRLRNYTYGIDDTLMSSIMRRVPLKPLLSKGDFFDVDLLEEERLQVNMIMRNAGYYTFSKEYVYFKADTTLNSHQVDLYLNIYPSKDSLPYNRYKLNKITVISGVNTAETPDRITDVNKWFFRNADTTEYKGITIIRGRRKFLRNSTIHKNNYLRTGMNYMDLALNRTYEAYNKMGAVKQVNISTQPSRTDSTHLLDATIILMPANSHWFKAGLDGTNSAGDIGIAPSVTYQHHNLFNGGEQLNIRLKGAYEFMANSKNNSFLNQSYYEYGLDASLSFPLFLMPWLKQKWKEIPSASTQFSIGFTDQRRPEYTRQFFNLTLGYGWTTQRNRIQHTLDLVDLNYVRMPWVADTFETIYLNKTNNPLLSESYKNQLVERTAYSATITNARRFNALYPTYIIRSSFEVAGLIPRLVALSGGAKKNSIGEKEILGVAYAEYIKGSIDYARTFYFSKKHSFAYHAMLGLAYPYGNSNILPFERRYFAGGTNSIRGWNTRTLGPGSYKKNGDGTDFVNQTGDVKFEMSIEDRHKISKYFEIATFIDAGNIWTIKDYPNQPGGVFKFNSFYKEIGVSYGLGIRFDLGFLLLRLDGGMKAYDPGEDQSNRFVLLKPALSRAAWHFGIGYPF